MRWTRRILWSAIAVPLLIGSTSAAAYVDSGFDPKGDSTDEIDGYPIGYDISFTTRSVVQGPRRMNLRIGTRLHDPDFWVGAWVYVDARLDARGGRQADAVLHMWVLDMSGNGCELQTRGGRLIRKGTLRFVGERETEDALSHYVGVSCRVPVYGLHPTKEIRWKVIVTHGNGEPVIDLAPNEAMFT